MTDSAHNDDEDRWLEARERGEPLPVIPEATAATYAQLQSLLEDLPAAPDGASLHPDWQQAVLDAIDRGGADPARADAAHARSTDAGSRKWTSKRRVAVVASCLVVAAGVAIALRLVSPKPTIELTISAMTTGETTLAGAEELRAGGRAAARGVVDGPGELRVYGADDVELARCTVTGPACYVARSGEQTELRVELLLPLPGPLHVVLLSAPLRGPSRGRSRDLMDADRAGITFKTLDRRVL